MAAPATTRAIWDNVIISVDNTSLVIIGMPPNSMAGTVEAIGLNVTRVVVGNVVLFTPLATFTLGSDTSWAIVPQTNILAVYTGVAP